MSSSFNPNNAAAADSGVFGLPFTRKESRLILVPVPYEATTSYGGGTAQGPEAIRKASKQVDLYDLGTHRPYESGIFMMETPAQVQRWNKQAQAFAAKTRKQKEGSTVWKKTLKQVNTISSQMNEWVYEQTRQILEENKIPGLVGGDHSTPFGATRACAERYPGLGILHIDAHADLRPAYEGFTWSHASIFYNVMSHLPKVSKLVQVGLRDFCEEELNEIQNSKDRIIAFFDEDLARRKHEGTPWLKLAGEMIEALPKHVYISFDIDGLDPALCPHTGTPVPGGLQFQEAVTLLAALVRSGRTVVGFDLNEVSPGPKGNEWDANVGARMLYKLIGYALGSQKPH